MRAKHNNLILIYLQSKIDKLDKVHKKAKKYAVDGKTTCRDFIDGLEEGKYRVVSGTSHTTILGSSRKVMSIEKLLKDKEADATFMSFSMRTMSEIRALSPTSRNMIPVSGAHQVHRLFHICHCLVCP